MPSDNTRKQTEVPGIPTNAWSSDSMNVAFSGSESSVGGSVERGFSPPVVTSGGRVGRALGGKTCGPEPAPSAFYVVGRRNGRGLSLAYERLVDLYQRDDYGAFGVVGFHSRARFCASAICARVIFAASASRLARADTSPAVAARLYHLCAST